MEDLLKWLLRDEQQGLFDAVVALISGALFLGVSALVLWPLGMLALVPILLRGFAVLWGVTLVSALVLWAVHRVLRVSLEDRAAAFVITSALVSCTLQLGWAAFVALRVRGLAEGASGGAAAGVYAVGGLSCFVALHTVSVFFSGSFYRLISFPLALLGFVCFCVWPAAARGVFSLL